MKAVFFKKSIIAICCSLLPFSQVHAQAGSSVPVVFESADAFFDSLSLGFTTASGSQREALLPREILQVSENTRYVFWVEMEQGKLKVLERQNDGGFSVRQIIPVSIGSNGFDKHYEGDKRTPLGVYYFTSFLNDDQLMDFYGSGAFPMNYPNAWDLLEGRTGSGIWLHGLPKDIAQRPLLDSDGCVVIDNHSLMSMTQYIDPGRTPVIMTADEVQWVPLRSVQHRRESLAQALASWQADWESRDNSAYLSWYADDFNDLTRNLEQWSAYKSRVNDGKNFIDLEFSDISFITDPRDPEVVMVSYYQRYRSSNYNWNGWKQQLWRQNDSSWEIIFEGNR